MASGTPLTGEQRARVIRLAQQNYTVLEIKDLTGYAKSTIQRILQIEQVYPEGYIHRPRKPKIMVQRKSILATCKEELTKFFAIFGIGVKHEEPKKKRRHRKPRKEMNL